MLKYALLIGFAFQLFQRWAALALIGWPLTLLKQTQTAGRHGKWSSPSLHQPYSKNCQETFNFLHSQLKNWPLKIIRKNRMNWNRNVFLLYRNRGAYPGPCLIGHQIVYSFSTKLTFTVHLQKCLPYWASIHCRKNLSYDSVIEGTFLQLAWETEQVQLLM
jgi:hypothetical protein